MWKMENFSGKGHSCLDPALASFHGRPRLIRTDPEAWFISRHWLNWLSEQRILGSSQPGEAHWRTSTVVLSIQTLRDGATRLSHQMQESTPVDKIFALVNTAFSDVVSVLGHSPHELSFGQLVSDALEVTLDSDDILLANSESRDHRHDWRRLALHAVIDSVSAARLRRAAGARIRKYLLGNLVSCVSSGEWVEAQSNFLDVGAPGTARSRS